MSDSAVLNPPPIQSASSSAPRFKLPPNWEQIESDYIRGATVRELSAKYTVPVGTISARCNRHAWETKRTIAAHLSDGAIAQAEECIQERIQPYKERNQHAAIAQAAVDLTTEALRWKERTYKSTLKIAEGIDKQTFEDGQSKKLAEVASALASIDATARRQLGLDVADAEDFGGVQRYTGRPGDRPIMRRAQVIDVAPVEQPSTHEAFDPGI